MQIDQGSPRGAIKARHVIACVDTLFENNSQFTACKWPIFKGITLTACSSKRDLAMPRVKTPAIHGPCGTLVSQPFSRALARLGGMWMGCVWGRTCPCTTAAGCDGRGDLFCLWVTLATIQELCVKHKKPS